MRNETGVSVRFSDAPTDMLQANPGSESTSWKSTLTPVCLVTADQLDAE